MTNIYIKTEKITRNKKGEIAKVVFDLSNKAKITAQGLCESWQQWGGTQEELRITMPRVEELNDQFTRDKDYK